MAIEGPEVYKGCAQLLQYVDNYACTCPADDFCTQPVIDIGNTDPDSGRRFVFI